MSFTGLELYRIWQEGKERGLSQRRLAKYLGMSFNALHGKIWREQVKMQMPPEGDRMFNEFKREYLRPVVFDIETTSLKSGGVNDHLVCCSFLPLDAEEPYTLTINFDDQRDDKRILQEVVTELEKYTILIGHNIAAYDLSWLMSRLAYHNMSQPTTRWLIYDTYQATRRQAIKADRKSLAFLCDFFRVEYVKTAVLPVSWSMIDSPNRGEFEKALGDIVFHCEHDVLANRKIFDVLWPLDRSMTNLPVWRK